MLKPNLLMLEAGKLSVRSAFLVSFTDDFLYWCFSLFIEYYDSVKE